MSGRFRILWNSLGRLRNTFRLPNAVSGRNINIHGHVVTFTVGFSLFTWLGFEKKFTVEDEIIQSIKHCVLFIQKGEHERAEQLLHVALRQAQQIQHQLGITYIYDVMANLALEREELNKAKKLFVAVAQRIMADGATEDDIRLVHISSKLARISHLQKEYTTAQLGYDWCLEKLKKAHDINRDNESKKLLAIIEDWYGRLYLDCDQNEQGLLLLRSALDLMEQIPCTEKEQIVVQLNDIGTVYDKLGKLEESIQCFKQAVSIGKDLNMRDLGAMHVNLGRVYIKKNLIEQARKSCGYALKLGSIAKNNDVKKEANLCLKEIKSQSQ